MCGRADVLRTIRGIESVGVFSIMGQTNLEFSIDRSVRPVHPERRLDDLPRAGTAAQFNTGDWDPVTGMMTGDPDLGRPRFLIDQEMGHAGDVTLGDVHDFADPPPGTTQGPILCLGSIPAFPGRTHLRTG